MKERGDVGRRVFLPRGWTQTQGMVVPSIVSGRLLDIVAHTETGEQTRVPTVRCEV